MVKIVNLRTPKRDMLKQGIDMVPLVYIFQIYFFQIYYNYVANMSGMQGIPKYFTYIVTKGLKFLIFQKWNMCYSWCPPCFLVTYVPQQS